MFQRILTVVFCVYLFGVSAQPVCSEVYNFEPIDSLFKLITINNKGMGSIAIRKDGNLLY